MISAYNIIYAIHNTGMIWKRPETDKQPVMVFLLAEQVYNDTLPLNDAKLHLYKIIMPMNNCMPVQYNYTPLQSTCLHNILYWNVY